MPQSYVHSRVGDISEIVGFRSGIHYGLDSEWLGVRRIISSPDSITLRFSGNPSSAIWGIKIRENAPLIEDYVKFLLDSGVFYAELLDKKNKRLPLHVLKSDLSSFELPVINLDIQMSLAKLETSWEWAVNELQSPYRYAALRAAMFDEIRHLVAIELYFPERMHALNIHAIDALLEIDEMLSLPYRLFNHLTLRKPEIMNQIKRFRSIVF